MSVRSIISVLLISAVIHCDALEVAEVREYPLVIEPIPILELDALNTKYHEENDGKICSTLNEYGFTGFSRVLFIDNINPCNAREAMRIELNYSDKLVSKAKLSLVKNEQYTLVNDTSDLVLQEVQPLYGCTICEGPETNSVPIEWKITFSAQYQDNIPVRNSEIIVFTDHLGVNRIWGNWYPDFYAPGLINIGYEQAKERVIGQSFDMKFINGDDKIFTVQEEHILHTPTFEFLPVRNQENYLELRKTWRVTVAYDGDNFQGWLANVDVIDGSLLKIERNNS